MTDFQVGLLLLLTVFIAGFICGMIVGVRRHIFAPRT
jgi:hypothetical protein